MSLKGKTLFISGASRGIGLAIALRAARDGANIAVAAKTTEPHPKLPGTIYTAAAEIEKAGGAALPLVCDIREEEQVAAAGSVDVLFLPVGGQFTIGPAEATQVTTTPTPEWASFPWIEPEIVRFRAQVASTRFRRPGGHGPNGAGMEKNCSTWRMTTD